MDKCELALNTNTFQLTRPAGGEPYVYQTKYRFCNVSTHSPRGGRTSGAFGSVKYAQGFNSLAPRGANPIVAETRPRRQKFHLTPPAGGEPRKAKR